MRRSAILLLAFILAVACGDGPTEPGITVDGVWTGEGMMEGGGTFTFRLTMSEADDGQVSGTGAFGITSNPDLIPLDILGGAHTPPDLSLTLGATGYEDMTFTGVVTETRITGNVDGSGFTGEEVVLTKQ